MAKRHITNGIETLFVLDGEVDSYLAMGWVVGSSNKITQPKPWLTISKWMNDTIQNKRVHPDLIKSYLKLGWVIGRARFGDTIASMKWINNDGGKERRVLPEHLDSYPAPPWVTGRSLRYVCTEETKQKISEGQKRRYATKHQGGDRSRQGGGG